MKLDSIKLQILELMKDRFVLEGKSDFEKELLSFSDEDLKQKEILRIKRFGIKVDSWKTLVLVEIEADNESDIKVELKKAITWISLIKESLLGNENTDLYLFLTFSSEGVSIEECLRIESTEKFCRKYVLRPEEDIIDFIDRTFLQKRVKREDTIDGEDPLEKAFSKTVDKYNWLTAEKQKRWKNAFSSLSGTELVDALLKDEELA